MKTITLAEYHHGSSVSWAKADCDHRPGMWRRNVAIPGLHNRFVTECRVCGVTLHAEGTQGGTITKKIGW